MSTSSEKAKKLIKMFENIQPWDKMLGKIAAQETDGTESTTAIPGLLSWTKESWDKRLKFLETVSDKKLPILSGKEPTPSDPEFYKGNIENFIGMTQVPTGLVGPLHINGTAAK